MTKRKGVQGVHHHYVEVHDTRTPSGTPASRGHWVDPGERAARCPHCGWLMRFDADAWVCWADATVVNVRAAGEGVERERGGRE